MTTTLVTGAAGSLGRVLCKKLIERGDKVRAMDINECALADMKYPLERFTKIYGDISDPKRIGKAIRGVDFVIHCAALKNLLITEWNPEDCIRINIDGTLNIADACVEKSVKKAIFISSDKAVESCNLYGATKLSGEQIWKAWARRQTTTCFTIIRSGNFFESSGNVFDHWDKCIKEGKPLPLTDSDMERYFIDVDDLADIILTVLEEDFNGCVVIPEMKLYNLMDLMLFRYGESVSFITTGKRQGEKLKEKLKYDDEQTIYVCNDYFVVK